MGEAVEQGSGEAFGAEDFGPFLEGQVAGHQGGAALVALAENLEEQFGAGLGQRHEAQFIDDQQLIAGDLLLEAEQLLFVAGLDQFADQRGGGGEAHAMSALAGSQSQGQGDVRLAGAARYQNIMPIVRRRSRSTTSGIRCVGRICVCEGVFSCRQGSTSLESFPMAPSAVFQHG